MEIVLKNDRKKAMMTAAITMTNIDGREKDSFFSVAMRYMLVGMWRMPAACECECSSWQQHERKGGGEEIDVQHRGRPCSQKPIKSHVFVGVVDAWCIKDCNRPVITLKECLDELKGG